MQVEGSCHCTKTADFHVCRNCGATPVVTSTIEGHVYAVVSVHAFDNGSQSMLRETPASFDGETGPTRVARRAKNWIQRVAFVDARAVV